MANTSSTGGVLSPADTPAPLEDDALDDLFQSVIVQITGLDGSLVRPRFQPDAPKQPEASVDWCAMGVMTITADAGPSITHVSSGLGSDTYVRHEDIELLASFYGPHSKGYASRLRDGLAIAQNVEALQVQDISFVECFPIRPLNELVNQTWRKRNDIGIRFRRKVTRVYAVQNIALADIHLIDDTHIDETITVPPAP